MIRALRYLGDPVLRKHADPVKKIGPEIRKLIDDMFETMDAAHGIGLAAPQVGVMKRVIVTNVPEEDGSFTRGALINAEIVSFEEETELFEEGCLSIPHVRADVDRPVGIRVRAIDGNGRKVDFLASDLYARCIQHEVDHLNGVLFIDRAGISEKKALKMMQTAEEDE
ncbi:MAG: peptide deformylase [Candidatus Hydrogenedentota bacterium]